jgi:hypothetical protein
MAKREMPIEDVLTRLDEHIARAGGVRAFARQIGVSPQYLSAIRGRNTPPSDRVLDAIGVRRIYIRR